MDPFPKPPAKDSLEIVPFSEKARRCADALAEIIQRTSDEDFDKFITEKSEFEERLGKKYSDVRKYEMFHALIGSSITKAMALTHDDFPGEDSVEEFVRRSVKKYLPSK